MPCYSAHQWPAIQLLDATLANQIAAGEVIRAPCCRGQGAGENALDAGAKRVEIDLQDVAAAWSGSATTGPAWVARTRS